MWEDVKGLELWWERVRDKRADRTTSPSSESADEELVSNDLAREFKAS